MFRIDYSPEARDHLRSLTKRDRTAVIDAVDRQLTHQPTVSTRNRKQMRPNLIGTWELRVGRLRVFYVVQDDPESVVFVRAAGVKERSVLRIAGEEVNLEGD